MLPPLFLEATQRKTERTAIVELRDEPDGEKLQVVGTATPRKNRRRPTDPGVADIVQLTRTAFGFFAQAAVAEARGCSAAKAGFFFAEWPTRHPVGAVGVPSGPLFLEATQRKTVRTVTVVFRPEPDVAEIQEMGAGTHHCRCPAEPVAADAI